MQLATIEEIRGVRPHPNADRLDLATVLGWQTITRRGEFKTGDRVVFIVIDTVLPDDAPWAQFLRTEGKPTRLNTVKLRGEYSQGLCLPLDVLPEDLREAPVGTPVDEVLGVQKYEKPLSQELTGKANGGFPIHITPSTDEENVFSFPDLERWEEILSGPITVTQKLNGSSFTMIVRDGELAHVCSRRLDLSEAGGGAFWRLARRIHLPVILDGSDFLLQGEWMGPGCQGNELELEEPAIFPFQMRLLDRRNWFTYREMVDALRGTAAMPVQLMPVPVLKHPEILPGTPVDHSLRVLQEFANRQKLPNGRPAEGIVVRPADYRAGGVGRPLGFKIINQNYKD